MCVNVNLSNTVAFLHSGDSNVQSDVKIKLMLAHDCLLSLFIIPSCTDFSQIKVKL